MASHFTPVRPQPIDHALGFPRTLDRAEYFEQTIELPLAVLVLDCPEEVMKERLAARAEILGRVDDNESIIKRRLDTFANETKEVIDHYDQSHLLIRIDGLGSKYEVQSRVSAAVDKAFADRSHS
jgi:adenylate kinase family enzyme